MPSPIPIAENRSVGPYRLLSRLGAGELTEVWFGRGVDGQEVAIKLLAPALAHDHAFIDRFIGAFFALVDVRHPNLARPLAHGLRQQPPWIASEYVSGPNLREMLAVGGALHEAVALALIRQAASALGAVWSKAQIRHGDIKPSNLLVVDAGIAAVMAGEVPSDDALRVVDLALASTLSTSARITPAGPSSGPVYIAPEQLRGLPNVDARADMYALGATMFELVTNQAAFPGGMSADDLFSVMATGAPDPTQYARGLKPATRRLIITALEPRREDRFPDWDAFIAACDAAVIEVAGARTGTLRLLRKPMVVSHGGSAQQLHATCELEATSVGPDLDDPFAQPVVERPADPGSSSTARRTRAGSGRHATVAPGTSGVTHVDSGAHEVVQGRSQPEGGAGRSASAAKEISSRIAALSASRPAVVAPATAGDPASAASDARPGSGSRPVSSAIAAATGSRPAIATPPAPTSHPDDASSAQLKPSIAVAPRSESVRIAYRQPSRSTDVVAWLAFVVAVAALAVALLK